MFSKITLAQFPQVAIFGKANVKEPIRVVVIIFFFLIVLQIRKSQSSKWNSERAERYKLTEFMNSDRKLAFGTTTYIRNDPRVDSEKKELQKGEKWKNSGFATTGFEPVPPRIPDIWLLLPPNLANWILSFLGIPRNSPKFPIMQMTLANWISSFLGIPRNS